MKSTLPRLQQGLTELHLDSTKAPELIRFAEMLLETNKVMNLTAITEPSDVASLHLLDCAALAAMEDFSNTSIIDVGTGAGFPGIPLQVLIPSARLTLLDSLGKRIRFLEQVCTALELDHTACIHARAEEYAREHRESFDYAVSRAVAALPVLCELALPMVKVDGAFLAMKALQSDEEIQSAKSAIAQLGGRLESVREYRIPATEVVRRVVIIRKIRPTSVAFPRAFARIKKNPLH